MAAIAIVTRAMTIDSSPYSVTPSARTAYVITRLIAPRPASTGIASGTSTGELASSGWPNTTTLRSGNSRRLGRIYGP